MPLSAAAEDFLRARTLGFHTPRPGSRPSPRTYVSRPLTRTTVEGALISMGIDTNEVSRFERCVSRRRVAWVEFDDRAPLLVKWPDEEAELNNNYESVALTMLREIDLPPRYTSSVPALVGTHDGGKMLALDVLEHATSLRDLLGLSPRLTSSLLGELAECLAAVHDAGVGEVRTKYPEWDLMLPVPVSCQLSLEEYSWGCGLDFEAYLKVMQRLEADFVVLHDNWTHDSLIHFDLRDDNVLFSTGDRPVCRLIDWELAGFGDALYDVGYLVAYLLLPMVRAQAGGSKDSSEIVNARRNIADFVAAYSESSQLSRSHRELIVRYAGLTLVVHASMRLQQMGALGKIGHLCLLMGERLITQPEKSGLT